MTNEEGFFDFHRLKPQNYNQSPVSISKLDLADYMRSSPNPFPGIRGDSGQIGELVCTQGNSMDLRLQWGFLWRLKDFLEVLVDCAGFSGRIWDWGGLGQFGVSRVF